MNVYKGFLFRCFGMKKKKKLTSPSKTPRGRKKEHQNRTNGFRDGYEEDKMTPFIYLLLYNNNHLILRIRRLVLTHTIIIRFDLTFQTKF